MCCSISELEFNTLTFVSQNSPHQPLQPQDTQLLQNTIMKEIENSLIPKETKALDEISLYKLLWGYSIERYVQSLNQRFFN